MSFANNAASVLASGISSSSTTLSVTAGSGALFPVLTGSKYFYCTLANSVGAIEIIKVTARSSDTFTVVRGQDGTTAVAWNAGDKVELRIVAAVLNNLAKLDEANTFTGANAYGTPASLVLTNATGTPASLGLANATGLPLTTGVTGTLPTANGGTNSTATPTAGGIGYGTGTAHAYTAAGTAGQILVSAGSSVPVWAQNTINSKTALAYNWNGLTTNTYLDFTSIPSGVKRITVMLNGISTNGTSGFLVQIGPGFIDTTGYIGGVSSGNSGVGTTTSTAGFYINRVATASATYSGHLLLTLVGSNTWVGSGVGFDSSAAFNIFAGNKSLSGAIVLLRVTTVNGIDIFDAGSANIFYE